MERSMRAIISMIPSLSSLSSLPQPFSSLAALVKAEHNEASKIRLSKLGWWSDVFRIQGSTIPRIWSAVIIFTLWSIIISTLGIHYGEQLGLSNTAANTLIVVVGLCLVFRNASAYARWESGRTTMGNMMSAIRSLSRSVWINVGAPGPNSSNTLSEVDHQRQDKTVLLRLLVAVLVATKHHVRREYGTDYEDLRTVLPLHFHATSVGYGYDAADADVDQHRRGDSEFQEDELARLRRATRTSGEGGRNSSTTAETTPLLLPHHSEDRRHMHTSSEMVVVHNYLSKPSLPLPIILVYEIGLHFSSYKTRGYLESLGPAGYNALNLALNQLVADFTVIDRLAMIGIPTVYGVHLKQCTSLFLLTLPFTLIDLMRWWTIPFVTVCAFTLLGIEGIATEIEQPFGGDSSDLSMDLNCAEVRNEIEHMISRCSWRLP